MKKNFLALGTCAFALALGFVACGDDSGSGSDDSSLTPVESEIDLVGGKKITCNEKMEGVVAALVNGDFRRCEDGAWVKISREEALKTDEILGYSSSSVKAGSSSSAKIASSSSAKVVGSSSSGTPAVDPDPVPEIYECPDGSFVEVEEDCPFAGSSSSDTPDIDPDVNPGEVPGSNSSSEDDVKPDGYYSNSSNCPAGLTCKYATTTEYLNSTKTYGEILDTRDGQVYKTIEICDKENKNCQTWMAQNLNYAPDPETVSSKGGYAWSGCYGDESANCAKYGRLYTWEVAMDKAECGYGTDCHNSYEGTQGVCPEGWHLPSHREFEVLINYIDPTFGYGHTGDAYSSTAGKSLKSKSGWNSGGNGTDAYGFSALPGGRRNDYGDFNYEGYYAYFWSSGENYDYNAFSLFLVYNDENAYLRWNSKNIARSVRCLKDIPDQGGEATNPDVTPDPVPGSNSSSSEEDAAGVMPDGYYSNSSKCPAGLTCKYATATTEYLNSTKTYGEILDTRDGQVYKTIEICDKNDENCQTWMAQNLNYAPDLEKVSSMGDFAWSGCYGEGSEGFTEEQVAANCSKYGRLYTWEVAMDKSGCGYGNDCNNNYEGTQGVCPSGWHLPSDVDWRTLLENVEGTGTAGLELKSSSGWSSGNGTNSFGFAVLPAGYRNHGGDFDEEGNYAYFWSSTEYNSNITSGWNFDYEYDPMIYASLNKNGGFSVRCLRD